MEIRLLPEETISRIAAGEVIERPVNVVKELVENSIDAGSTAVTVEIRDGGISMIRVTDNGCGIERDQISRAFIRHATSKITDAEDLSHLSSLGFRGEALASIAAVSQVEMITKVRGAISGTRAVNDHLAAYSPDAPVQIDLSEIGAPDGTTVIVRNLFGSIPVRRRFLRQPQTEAGYITELMEKQALSHPDISFHYRVNGQDKLHTSGNGNLRELIYRIYGRETAGALVPVCAEDPDSGISLSGFLGKPEISRSSRSFEIFFINGRMLRSKELSAGLEEGYRTDLMQHRFPFAVLHLTMPPEDVDVNVHPSKMEVRFTDRRKVFRFLDTSVHETLHAQELIPRASVNTAREEREQKRKEARLKQEQLQKTSHYEPFETSKGSRRLPSSDPLPLVREGAASGGSPDGFVFEDRRAPRPTKAQQLSFLDPDYPPVSESSPDQGAASDFPRNPGPGFAFSQAPGAGQTALPDPGTGSDFSQDSRAASASSQDSGVDSDSPQEPGMDSDFLPEPGLDSASRETPEKEMQSRLLTQEKADRYKYIGQIFGTYWIIEYEKKILIIDQHAAHEKVNYERMMRRIERDLPGLEEERTVQDAAPEEYLALDRLLRQDYVLRQNRQGGPDEESPAAGTPAAEKTYVASQQLLPPIILRLSGKEETAYREFQNVFAAMGYEIEEFGAGSYAVRAVPAELFGSSAESLLRETLDEIMNERVSGTPRAVIARIASMSCKAAVKGSSRLSETEARALIEELLSLDNPYHCPHGRPTMIVMSQQEMDRKFKRIV